MDKLPEWMDLYKAWQALDNGASAQLRRTKVPDDLRDIPAFYHLVQPLGWENPQWQKPLLRMVFCLSVTKDAIRHIPAEADKKPVSIGAALAYSGKINERRVYQLLRAEWPNDMVQLRRLIAHAELRLHWPEFAKLLYWWNAPNTRRQILEDFIITTHHMNTKKKSA